MSVDILTGSVTHWLEQLREGEDGLAQQALWERYFHRLAGVARRHLPAAARRAADQEDIALSALHSFFSAARQGRYPQLSDRTELWPLLAHIATCKAIKQARRESAQKRGGGTLRGDSAVANAADDGRQAGFDELAGAAPSPAVVAELNELVTRLFATLENDSLREVARQKLDGYRNWEIAKQLDVSERTVERKLLRIRKLWSRQMGL